MSFKIQLPLLRKRPDFLYIRCFNLARQTWPPWDMWTAPIQLAQYLTELHQFTNLHPIHVDFSLHKHPQQFLTPATLRTSLSYHIFPSSHFHGKGLGCSFHPLWNYYYVFHGRVTLFFANNFLTQRRITMKF